MPVDETVYAYYEGSDEADRLKSDSVELLRTRELLAAWLPAVPAEVLEGVMERLDAEEAMLTAFAESVAPNTVGDDDLRAPGRGDGCEHLRTETQMMNFVEVRLRPNVRVQPEEVEAYYRAQLLPDLEAAGVKLVTLQEVEPKIRELLVQQHIDQLLDAWLHNLREQTPVHSTVALPASSANDGVGGI